MARDVIEKTSIESHFESEEDVDGYPQVLAIERIN